MKLAISFLLTAIVSGFFGYCACAIIATGKIADMQAEILRLMAKLREK